MSGDLFVMNPETSLLDAVTPGLDPFPGAVALASISRPQRYGTATKLRPVILQGCFDSGRSWRYWALTSMSHYDGGRGPARRPVPGLDVIGLADSWLWCDRLQELRAADLVGTVWAAPRAALEAATAGAGGLLEGWARQVADDFDAAGWWDFAA